jgi:hypothetical protein
LKNKNIQKKKGCSSRSKGHGAGVRSRQLASGKNALNDSLLFLIQAILPKASS